MDFFASYKKRSRKEGFYGKFRSKRKSAKVCEVCKRGNTYPQFAPEYGKSLSHRRTDLYGGAIYHEFCKNAGLDQEMAGTWCSVTLVFISVILTGFNIYPKIGKFGGAGSLVPITGFANSVAAPAIEFKTEGQVFGIGCKIFTIAGPVILYGIMSSWLGRPYLLHFETKV